MGIQVRESTNDKVREVSLFWKNSPECTQNFSSKESQPQERPYSPRFRMDTFEIDQIELIEEGVYKTISNQTK